MYRFVESVRQSYNLLQDDLSKKIFWARFRYDFDPSPENLAQIVSLGEQNKWLNTLIDSIPSIVRGAEQSHRKLVLYGTSMITGQTIGALFLERQIDFYGFCGRRASEFTNGLMGKPVISPDYLFQHQDEFFVILAAQESRDELLEILNKNHFPMDQVYSFYPIGATDNQYFEFPSLFAHGTAFIDGGSLDCRSAYCFADWCNGNYSKIYAFEPDPVSYAVCEKNLSNKRLKNCQLIRAGLSDHDGQVIFKGGLGAKCYVITDKDVEDKENLIEVPVTTIDRTIGEETVGFIKMDIEGSELDALRGAEKVIIRDKPLISLSVYHRIGDMPVIMDYLHQLVPEYRFWLRHYSIGFADTVLYASIKQV